MTSAESELGFIQKANAKAAAFEERREAFRRENLKRRATFVELVLPAKVFASSRPASLFILEKGKPVARPGRKVKGQRVTAGSLTAERVMIVRQAMKGTESLLSAGFSKVSVRPARTE